MRFSSIPVAFFAGVALASPECLAENSNDLAAYADCAHQGTLVKCLVQLNSFQLEDVRGCYTNSGCSPSAADQEAQATIRRCEELAKTGELKKRFRAAPVPAATLAARAASTDSSVTTTGGVLSGTVCFTTYQTSIKDCATVTTDGRTKNGECSSKTITTSSCDPTMVCTVQNNQDLCMEIVRMDVGGIVVTLVFAGALVIGAAALTWSCCKDRKQQKKLVAKAEAVALARAATKKQRAAQRAPLLRNPSGGSNPFQDQARS